MRFKISQQGANRHTKPVTCIVWIASDEIYSCSDDHKLISWKFEGGTINSKIVTDFAEDFYPTDMQWHPRPMQSGSGAVKKQALDVLLITTSDGKFHLVNKNGRIEKSVAAHNGATISGKWSYDGTALFTAGEDGLIKVWSRSGMLRSTAIRGNQPVYASAWNPDNSAILYGQGPFLIIQSLTTSAKPLRWQAHEGIILTVCWNQFNGFIVSGGEDCRHKVWDNAGNPLYASVVGDQPITAANWCFSGSHFAVGSFNTLKLCDKTGWSHSLEKTEAGSIYDIAWSSDNTQVALACSSGAVQIAHTIEKKIEYDNYEATLIKRKAIQVVQVGSDVNETLDIADRVIQMEFGFDHLVLITPSQCHIYSTKNWNTPAIFDLKNGSVSAVLLADKHFLLVEWNVISLYSYQGRSVGNPKWKNMILEPLHPPCISVCADTIVIRDQLNHKLLHVLEVSPKKPIAEGQNYLHMQDITSLALNYLGGVSDRQLALVDVNKDLFLISIRSAGFGRVCKIAAMAQSLVWATDANVLAGMLDSTLSVWLCPSCVHYSDRKIIRKTRVDKDSSEFGKHPTIVNVRKGFVTVRRGDGAIIVSSFYTFFTKLHHHILKDKWEEAISLCRIVQNETLWTCMAVMAIDGKELNIAEEACAAIGRYDKVDYIRYIKKLPNELERLAEMSLLAGDLLGAEGILLQNGLISEAIRMNIEMYNWARALELALKHKKLLGEVLEARKRYLAILDKKEVNQSFHAVQANIAKAHAAKKEAKEKERDKEREMERKAEMEINEKKEENMEREIEKERVKQIEREEIEREKKREREETERERKREREREEAERERKREIEREKQKQKEREIEKELEKQRIEEEKQKQMERELGMRRELEEEKEKERERKEESEEKRRKIERAKERKHQEEKRREIEKEKEKKVEDESHRALDRDREKVKRRAVEREKRKEIEREKDKEKERGQDREKRRGRGRGVERGVVREKRREKKKDPVENKA